MKELSSFKFASQWLNKISLNSRQAMPYSSTASPETSPLDMLPPVKPIDLIFSVEEWGKSLLPARTKIR
jgi:hypothetical protein